MKTALLFTLWAGMFAGLLTLSQENKMRAKEAQQRSTTMQKAMLESVHQTPPSNQALLESPNTTSQRKKSEALILRQENKQCKARENFYRLAGQAQGLHVRF